MADYTSEISACLDSLYAGDVILYPTDTIWGLGCDATNEDAVKKVFKLKERSDSKSLICLLNSSNRLESYVESIPDIAWDLIDLADKPLTIVFPNAKNLAPAAIAEDGSVAIRICKEPFVAELIKRFKRPIISTSANISGEKPPQQFSDISSSLKDAVSYTVNYRQNDTTITAPSSIIKLGENGEIQILR